MKKIICILLCLVFTVGILASCVSNENTMVLTGSTVNGGLSVKSNAAVKRLYVNENNELIVVYANGEEDNLGNIKGDPGQDGKDGRDGIDGKDGRDGIDGINGTFEDLTEEQRESLRGPQGEKGEKGDQGEQGIQGEKGDKGDKGDRGEDGQDADISGTYQYRWVTGCKVLHFDSIYGNKDATSMDTNFTSLINNNDYLDFRSGYLTAFWSTIQGDVYTKNIRNITRVEYRLTNQVSFTYDFYNDTDTLRLYFQTANWEDMSKIYEPDKYFISEATLKQAPILVTDLNGHFLIPVLTGNLYIYCDYLELVEVP